MAANLNPQSKHWVFTLNNYSDDDVRHLQASFTDGPLVYLVFGYETAPTTGTPHLQGYAIFGARARRSTVLRVLGARCHVERARGTPFQCSEYCKKDGLYEECGRIPAVGSRGQFDQFIDWVRTFHRSHTRRPSEREIAQAYPALFVRYGKAIQQLIDHHLPLPVLETTECRDWQVELETALDDEADDRGVLFYVDPDGGKGKTWFIRRMLSKMPDRVQVLSAGKRDDLAHAIDPLKSIFLFNIPRDAMEFMQYSILEMLKDRMVFSPKYSSRMKILNAVPHVVVFSNEEPDQTKMTGDRYIMHHI